MRHRPRPLRHFTRTEGQCVLAWYDDNSSILFEFGTMENVVMLKQIFSDVCDQIIADFNRERVMLRRREEQARLRRTKKLDDPDHLPYDPKEGV